MIQRKQTLFLLLSLFASVALFLYLRENIIGIIINAIAALLALITVFLYKKRTLQVKLSYALMLLQLAITVIVSFGLLGITSIIGIIGAIAAYFAAFYIKKDIELLKSADRIR